jgi:hypothetical protein
VRTTQYNIRTVCIVHVGKELPNADAMAMSRRVGALGVGALRRAQLEHHVRPAARPHPGHPPPSNTHGVSRVRATQYRVSGVGVTAVLDMKFAKFIVAVAPRAEPLLPALSMWIAPPCGVWQRELDYK